MCVKYQNHSQAQAALFLLYPYEKKVWRSKHKYSPRLIIIIVIGSFISLVNAVRNTHFEAAMWLLRQQWAPPAPLAPRWQPGDRSDSPRRSPGRRVQQQWDFTFTGDKYLLFFQTLTVSLTGRTLKQADRRDASESPGY